MDITNDEYADIRPYHDYEVREVLDRLIEDDEFISAIINLRVKKQTKLMKALAYPFVRQRMRRRLRGITDVYGVQWIVKEFLDRMLKNSSSSFTVSGLEHLDKDNNYLFISNHRDIVLDPALVNYALITCGYPTVRIAIGDNLHSKNFISDLMRLNKSFIVKRSIKRPRERVTALRHLSSYIQHSLLIDQNNVWLAQGEGRAKDGNDRTQPAIIKMLSMSKPADIEFADFIKSLVIVPVAISYEYDPCDADKARELYIRASEGKYQKLPQEDFESIAKGIKGNKGDIHISFGTPLTDHIDTPEQVAHLIDQQIISNYRVHDANRIAFELQSQVAPSNDISPNKRSVFDQRLSHVADHHKPYLIDMYANVLGRKKDLKVNIDDIAVSASNN